MVNSNANALGIIFPNSYDGLIPELVTERLMASIPFAGRYRMVVECRQGQKRRRPVPARIRTVCYADSRLVI